MHCMQMAENDKCPLCNRKEDHEHRTNKCPYSDPLIQLISDLYKLVHAETGDRIERSRVCLDYPNFPSAGNRASSCAGAVEISVWIPLR